MGWSSGSGRRLAPPCGALAAVVLGCAIAAQPAGAFSEQARLERAALALGGTPVLIVCESRTDFTAEGGDADGIAFVGTTPTRIELAPRVCGALLHPARYGGDFRMDEAIAVAVLAHEIGHAVNGPCEYRAERFAMTHWRRLYRLLGLGTPTAEGIDAVRFGHDALPLVYRKPVCP